MRVAIDRSSQSRVSYVRTKYACCDLANQLGCARAKAANTYHAIIEFVLGLKPLLARARIRVHQAFQDGQLLKHLRARESRGFVANLEGALVKILQGRLHSKRRDAKDGSAPFDPADALLSLRVIARDLIDG